MKVSQLIEQLQYMDAEAEVHFAYNYGDHWHTTVAPRVSEVSEGVVEFSDYHRMDKLVDDEDCYDEETGDYKKDITRVVVIG
jgi:hypothetical protein